jgi:hypothetical protein
MLQDDTDRPVTDKERYGVTGIDWLRDKQLAVRISWTDEDGSNSQWGDFKPVPRN